MKQKITWDEAQEQFEKLSEKIKENHCIDIIVALSRGGLVPARYMAKHLNVRRIHCLGIEFYNNGWAKDVPDVYQEFTTKFEGHKKILIVDDITDSGKTFDIAVYEVMRNGGKDVLTCALHYKPQAKYKPDFIGSEIDNDIWVEYPWE